jgi:hypothetical protein
MRHSLTQREGGFLSREAGEDRGGVFREVAPSSSIWSWLRMTTMQTVKIIYWQEDDAWLGYLEEYPDYWTQGETFEDLEEHLKDLYQDLTGGQIPGVRKVGELLVS